MTVVQTPETIEPLAMSPEHAAAYLSISRRALSDRIADGAIIAKKDGTRTLVDVDSLKTYFRGLPKAVSGSIPNAPQARRKGRRS
jgi:excisionase family DNA binding protein